MYALPPGAGFHSQFHFAATSGTFAPFAPHPGSINNNYWM